MAKTGGEAEGRHRKVGVGAWGGERGGGGEGREDLSRYYGTRGVGGREGRGEGIRLAKGAEVKHLEMSKTSRCQR